MAANTATGESRRRKILDRGADRLAFIVGRTQTLPPESRDQRDSDSSQPLNSQLHRQDPPSLFSDQIAASNGKDGGFSSVLPTSYSNIDADHEGNNREPPSDTLKTDIETLITPPSNAGNNEQSSLASSTDHSSTIPSSDRMQHLEQLRPNRFVTPSQISSAIAATESSRLFSSAIISLFVVLSHLGLPLLGSNIVKSILSFGPLYLVLLTNFTLVLVRLLLNNPRGSDRIVGGENNIPSRSTYDLAEQAGNALEVGLVTQKAIDAILMDCSIYAIIVVAGFSFVW